ncbi:hypothetical protein [Streptomyces sp.]|uniref:hypothetical protein n=1 Tax=Streptomyces sp. TaxID=1931 RepID=UPI0028114EBA|nr:hypothetical protein [Streptomyces sp.]
MSLIHRPKTGKHRVGDRIAALEQQVAALRADNTKLLNFKAAADDYFMLLVDDRQHVYDAWQAEGHKRTEAEIVTAPPMHRDTTAVEDQATAPIDVRPLWDAHRPRQASWGRAEDDTLPLPAVREAS